MRSLNFVIHPRVGIVRCVPIAEAQLARLSVSFGEISWLGRGKSDFTATITDNFAKADPQISRLGVSYVPTRDAWGYSVRGLESAIYSYSCPFSAILVRPRSGR